MKPEKIIVAMLVFAVVIISGIMIIADVNNNYDDVDIGGDKFNEINQSAYDISDTYNQTGQSMKSSITNIASDAVDYISLMIKGGYAVLSTLFTIPDMIFTITNVIATELHIPVIFLNILTTILLISIIFAVIYLIFRLG